MVQLPQQDVPLSSDTSITSTPASGLKRLYGPAQPGVSGSPSIDALYTVPVGKSAVLTQIIICNTNALAKELTLGVNETTGAHALLHLYQVTTDDTVILNVNIPLAAGETLNAFQETANALTLTLIGTET